MAAVTQPVLANCFAAGTPGTAIPQGTGGAASLGTADGALFGTVITTGGTLTYDTTVAHSGTQSCKIVTAGNNQTCALFWTGSGLIINTSAQMWYRLYLYQAAWPAVLHPVFNFQVSGTKCADVVLNANGTLSVRDTASTVIVTTTATVPNSAWYRIEGYVTSSATAGQVELQLFASPDATTPTETQTSAADQDTLGGNINQARYGCATGVASGLTWWMDDVALSPSGYIGPGPVVFHMAAGAPAASGFTVCSKPVGGSSLRLKAATDPALTENVTYVPAQVPDQSGYVRHAVTGLSPATVYYCQLADTPPGGSEMLAGPVAQCRTLPSPGTASFTVAVASCIDTGDDQPSPGAAITDWIAWDADLNIFTGDYDYADPVDTTVTGQLGHVEYQSMYWGNAPLIQTAWGYSCRSDHDSTTDGGDSDNTWTAANLLAFQEAFPYVSPLPDPNDPVHGLYQSWVCGRVRFIMTDIRNTGRSPSADTDQPGKTMLGADQLAWLQEQLVMPEPLKVIITDTNWMGASTSTDSCGPGWTYYTYERGQITAFIAANQAAVQNVVLWHGDGHAVACQTGPGNPWGGFPVYCAAPVRQTGAAWSAELSATFAQVYNNSGGECRQYGRVTITDTGQQITVNFQGWDALNQVAQVEQTDVFAAPAGGGMMMTFLAQAG